MSITQKLRDSLHTWNKRRLVRLRAAVQKSYPHKLGVLGIMKNESLNIDEWISHYLAMGAAKIYLIDNGSTDDTLAKVQKWLEKGCVDLIVRHGPHQQRRHYWDAIRTFHIKKSCEWLIIADLDEFWFCPNGQPIASKLQEEQFSFLKVIYANWRIFGSSGLDAHPASIRANLVMAAPELDSHTVRKFMCRTKQLRTIFSFDLHHVKGVTSTATVSDNHNFHLNHYQIQSRSYFETSKMQRGDAVTKSRNTMRDWAYFDRVDAACTVEDRCLSDLVTSGKLPT
jgi:hypothetical protein